MVDDKEQEWIKYLVSLGSDVKDCRLTEYQACTAIGLWLRAIKQYHNVMYPTSGITEDGDLYMRWRTDTAKLTVEISFYNLSWFYTSDGYTDGTEEPVAVLPDQGFALLGIFTREYKEF